MNRLLLGYNPDFDLLDDALPIVTASLGHQGWPLATDCIEGATALLESLGRATLPAVLARLLRCAASAGGGTIDRAVEGALIQLLQRAAAIALPVPAAPAPGDGAARASRFFGVEFEGLSPEDREFECARRFMLLVRATAAHALHAPAHMRPAVVAWLAAAHAARRFAPGWLTVPFRSFVTAGRSRPHFSQGAHHA